MTTYNILYTIDGGGFRHAQVVGDLGADQLDLAAHLVAEQLTEQGDPRAGHIQVHRITPA